MSIQNRVLNERLSNLQRCAEKAPEGTHEFAKAAASAVDGAIEEVREIFRRHGFKPNGTDACRDLECAIYGFLLASVPDHDEFHVSEGFGAAVDTDAGSRVIAEAIRDRDSLAKFAEAARILGNRGASDNV